MTDPARNSNQWQPIETAPKGYPSLEEPSEWFLAYGNKYGGPKDFHTYVVRRCYGHGFGPFECSGDAYYKADFFTHWMPLPEAPGAAPTSELHPIMAEALAPFMHRRAP